MDLDRPWLAHYGRVPESLDYPQCSLYEALAATVARVPDAIALDFLGTSVSYRELLALVDRFALALHRLGLKRGERILVSLPTIPQAVIAFYAANRLGATPAMVHPLSTAAEVEHHARVSDSRVVVTLDALYDRVAALRGVRHIVLARIPDYLGLPQRAVFWLRRGRRIRAVPDDARVRWWATLLEEPVEALAVPPGAPEDLAAILFSGGTTADPKAIALTNRAFVVNGLQAASWVGLDRGDSMLAILPLFHGFGLAVCINATLMAGGRAILVPEFSAAVAAKAVRRSRPSFIVGPPTLFDALTREPRFEKADLSCLKGAFSGADTLPRTVKERFEALVGARGGSVRLMEGYGLTEAVAGVMAMPFEEYREGSIGVPLPDVRAAICEPGTTRHLAPGEEGEICVCAPEVMRGYLEDAQATQATLLQHDDGRTWLHTGDIGRMDADGFFYFTCRLKRMIKSSGFNVYPAEVEAVLLRHRSVSEVCVVGVPDERQVERVKAFVVPSPGVDPTPALAQQLIEHCRHELIKWSCPRDIEFRKSLPTTAVGKIDYRALARGNDARR